MLFTRLSAAVALCLALVAPALAQDDFPDYPGPAGWAVKVDTMDEMNRLMNREARRSNAPFFSQGISFEISRDEGPDHSFHHRKVLAEYWALQIANLLEEYRFRPTSEWRFRRLTGMTFDQFRARILEAVPYGLRDVAQQSQAQGLHVLTIERSRDCPGDNVFAAMVMPVYPTEDVASEYGDLSVVVIGGGYCASGRTGKAFINAVVEEVRSAVTGE